MKNETKSCDHMFLPEVIDSEREVKYKARHKTISMKIDDFLSMMPPSVEDNPKHQGVEKLIASGQQFDALPFLVLMCEDDGQTATVYGHEGRHRAMALRKLGFEEIPVILRTDIRWSEQNDANRFDYRSVWPTILVGSSVDQVRIPFPVLREDATKPYSGPFLTPALESRDELIAPNKRCALVP